MLQAPPPGALLYDAGHPSAVSRPSIPGGIAVGIGFSGLRTLSSPRGAARARHPSSVNSRTPKKCPVPVA